LKKQSQFTGGLNWRILFSGRVLWQYTGLRGTKKQSQFKASPFGSLLAQSNGPIPAGPAVKSAKLDVKRDHLIPLRHYEKVAL